MVKNNIFNRILVFAVLLFGSWSMGFAADYGAEVAREYGFYPDFASYQRLIFIGERLAIAAGATNVSFQVINDDSYNAFALPDGRIYVNSRLLCDATDGEIAFIIGHEITHVVQKHSKKQQNATLTALLLGYIGTKAVGGSDNDASTIASLAGALAAGQYSQKDETRSDEGGIKYMTMLGYDPKEATAGMKMILDRYGRGDASIPVLGLLASHPDTQKRYDNLVKIAGQYETNPPKPIDLVKGATLSIASKSVDKNNWLIDYSIILLPYSTSGKVAAITDRLYRAPIVPNSMIRSNNKDLPTEYLRRDYAITPNTKEYEISLATSGFNTTAQVSLEWKNILNGNSGVVIGEAISPGNTPITGRAIDEVANSNMLIALSDGVNDNVEGTVVAAALRRAFRMFNEVVANNGKQVDHSALFNVKLDPKKYKVGDYIYVVRKKAIVGEAKVLEFTAKDKANLRLIWGDKVDKKDTFLKAE